MSRVINIPSQFGFSEKQRKNTIWSMVAGRNCKIIPAYLIYATIQKRLVCSLNKNNKNQLRRRMEKCPLKDDYETEVLFNQSSDQSKPASHAAQELTTIDAIMDQIHQEVISTKIATRDKDNEERKVQCKKWGRMETENFYFLLSKMGPDFTNMELHQIFSGHRCKRQLKNKYRKEQKNNAGKVNSFLDICTKCELTIKQHNKDLPQESKMIFIT